jgi:hypothetical protein
VMIGRISVFSCGIDDSSAHQRKNMRGSAPSPHASATRRDWGACLPKRFVMRDIRHVVTD